MNRSDAPAAERAFAPSGACSSCPYRGSCHEPRKRIQDPLFSVGRHYECEFYRSIDADQKRSRPSPRKLPMTGSGA